MEKTVRSIITAENFNSAREPSAEGIDLLAGQNVSAARNYRHFIY
jgi:hypothetical protein